MSIDKKSKFKSKGRNNYNKGGKSDKYKEGDDIKNIAESTNIKSNGKAGRKGGNNDPSWYASSMQLLVDSASIPYSEPIGTVYDPTDGCYMPFDSSCGYSAIPGVCAIAIAPGVGYSDSEVSAVNIAARNIYSYVRHTNAGHANYNSPDLMMYLLAMDSAYSYYSFLTRVYGIMRTYSVSNRYMPKALITSMYLDFDDLQARLADLRYYVNLYATRMSSMVTPNVMNFTVRHFWMYQGVYKDSPVQKSQLYLFVPHGFHKFEPFVDTKGGRLKYLNWRDGGDSDLKTLDDLISFGNSLIEPLIADEDMNIMSGDILKSFGQNIFKLVMIGEDHITIPEYNEEVLSQIQNATLMGPEFYDVGLPEGSSTADITQTDDIILYKPQFDTETEGFKGGRTCTIRKDVVSPADTMVATRLMNTVDTEVVEETVGSHTTVSSLGSEVAMCAFIWRWVKDTDGVLSLSYHRMSFTRNTVDYLTGEPSPYMLSNIEQMLIEKFDWHPCIRLMACDGFTDRHRFIGECFDVDNYTKVDSYVLRKMHDTALMSMFAIPLTGTLGK